MTAFGSALRKRPHVGVPPAFEVEPHRSRLSGPTYDMPEVECQDPVDLVICRVIALNVAPGPRSPPLAWLQRGTLVRQLCPSRELPSGLIRAYVEVLPQNMIGPTFAGMRGWITMTWLGGPRVAEPVNAALTSKKQLCIPDTEKVAL